jgi:hypothetical protein
MSNALALAAITATLTGLLENKMPDTDKISSPVTVSAQAPDLIKADALEKPQLNLFLYQVTPNLGWANLGLPARDGRGERTANPPLALDLHYLLTAYAKEDFQAEILLGYAMQCLHERPALPRKTLSQFEKQWKSLPDNLVDALRTSGLAGQVEQIKICPEPFGVEELSKLWTAFQTSYRPTVAYRVSVVLIESALPARSPLPVLKRGAEDRGWDSVSGGIPQIEQILPTEMAKLPPHKQIVQQGVKPGAEITLKGRNLVADFLTVDFVTAKREKKTVEFSPTKPPTVTPAGDLQVRMPTDLPAGVISVSLQVHIPKDLSAERTPPDSWNIISNTVALVLRPVISDLKQEPSTDEKGLGVKVTFRIVPRVQPGQRGLLLLREIVDDRQDPKPRQESSIDFSDKNQVDDQVTVQLPQIPKDSAEEKVATRKYLVRVQIDGAEGQYRWEPGDDQTYPWPMVEI